MLQRITHDPKEPYWCPNLLSPAKYFKILFKKLKKPFLLLLINSKIGKLTRTDVSFLDLKEGSKDKEN